MERNPQGGRNVPPPPPRRGGTSFSHDALRQPASVQPRRPEYAPPAFPYHAYPSHQEGYDATPQQERPFVEEVLQPKELFDPYRNEEHEKWLRQQLKEVRLASFSKAGLLFSLSAMTFILSGVVSVDMDSAVPFACLLPISTILGNVAEEIWRKAVAKRKMGFDKTEE